MPYIYVHGVLARRCFVPCCAITTNGEFRKFASTIEDFTLQDENTVQINGYAEGLQQEFPRAHIERYVIYCIGNQGFRVFLVVCRLNSYEQI